MNTKSSKLNVFFRRQGILAVALLASVVVLGACSSSSDSGGNTGTSVTAFNFDANNSTLAAEIAAAAMSFFPEFTAISTSVIDILVNQSPSGSPFPILICSSGAASLAWNDADSSGDLTVGDSATLTFTNCDFDGGGDAVNGTVTITATNVNIVASPATSTLGYTVAVNLTVSGVDTTTIAVNFSATTSTPDGGMSFTSVYTAADTSGQTATISENGTEFYKMGCFNATLMYTGTEIVFGSTDMTVNGVIVAANKVMSLAAGANLTFIDGYMELGTQRLLSLSVPGCGSIGVPNGVGDSDGSYLDMEATGGGNITLHTFDSTNTETNTVNTTWDTLTN